MQRRTVAMMIIPYGEPGQGIHQSLAESKSLGRYIALREVGASVPECFRLARPRALRGQSVSGLQSGAWQFTSMELWIPAYNPRE